MDRQMWWEIILSCEWSFTYLINVHPCCRRLCVTLSMVKWGCPSRPPNIWWNSIRFSPNMTLSCTAIYDCIIQFKKRQTRHQVLRRWPHSSVCRSPAHQIGRPGLMGTSHTTDRIHGESFWSIIWGADTISASGNWRDVMQDGRRKQKWRLRLLWWTKNSHCTINLVLKGLAPGANKFTCVCPTQPNLK